jgi:hypothetical protein
VTPVELEAINRSCRAYRRAKGAVIMTSSVPSGDESRVDATSDSAVDPESSAATDLESDITADSAPGAAYEPLLAGPALENEEMRRATVDLESSMHKSAESKAILEELTETTDPTAQDA